jgi:hypothetical protein
MKDTVLTCLSFIIIKTCNGQTADSLFSKADAPFMASELPLININTHDQVIRDGSRITAGMGIIFNGDGKLNLITDPFNNYNGKIKIETRGSSSHRFPKKSYNFETRDTADNKTNVTLLGLPAENDWVLYAPYDDKSLMRDVMAYKIARDMGRYAPRTVFAELNLNGDYQGIYILEEKIKCSPHRVDITKITPADTTGDALTGGYILKIDRAGNDRDFLERKIKKPLRIMGSIIRSKLLGIKRKEPVTIKGRPETSGKKYIISQYAPKESVWQRIEFSYNHPDPEDLTTQQSQYIQNFMYKAESSLVSSDFTHPDSGYRKYFDAASMIDFFIANEVARNVDAYRLSAYFYKNRDSEGSKLIMGPLWDFNISMGNANYCNGELPEGWAYRFNSYCGSHAWLVPFWWERLMEDSIFKNELKCRWKFLRQSTLSTASLMGTVDSVAVLLNNAKQRNFQRWQILGKYIWPNKYIFSSYKEETDFLKQWLTERLKWLDQNMPGNCNDW